MLALSSVDRRACDAGAGLHGFYSGRFYETTVIDELAKQGGIVAGSNVTLARSGVGIAVRAGAPKPDIGSAEALKRALLNARSIAYTSTGQSGTYFAGLIERLGIAAEVKAKGMEPG
jgi:molybdate transport system substrate-binding protein